MVREALFRMREGGLPDDTGAVGGYWTRTNDPEIDVVAADRAPIARRITAVGSIKWLEAKPFDSRELSRLLLHRSRRLSLATLLTKLTMLEPKTAALATHKAVQKTMI